MRKTDLKKLKLPDAPGVYFFFRQTQDKPKSREIIYIGKATSLRDRVRSYFSSDLALNRGPKIAKMVEDSTGLDWQETDSVLEALILEANLIKKYQPKANTDGKDDKSFNFVVITDEDFPVVKTERGKLLLNNKNKYKYVFGPYPHGAELKEALKIIRRIFPYRDEKCHPYSGKTSGSKSKDIVKAKPCFNYQIGLCPGTCVGAISKQNYAKVIRSICLVFEGKKEKLIKDLTRHMNRLAKALKFEEAAEFKKKIFALQHIQDVALLKDRSSIGFNTETKFRIESYDIAHISGKYTVGAMAVMEEGEFKRSDYRKFKIKVESQTNSTEINDSKYLAQILERRMKHNEWPMPDLIVVDGGTAQINAAEKVLKSFKLKIPVVGVIKDDKHKARKLKGQSKIIHDYFHDIVRLNEETHRFVLAYHRQLRDRVIK
jgi:excinuclease ABC subunit C